jgi:hypothetical protein
MLGFGFINDFLEKWSFVPDGVLGGYCRGTGVDRVLGGYCRCFQVVMFD